MGILSAFSYSRGKNSKTSVQIEIFRGMSQKDIN
jgi:hypothetical protein